MQEIVAFCDLHVERTGQRLPGAGYRIGIAGAWKRIDLCAQCQRELLGPLEAVLLGHGREVLPPPPAPAKRRQALSDEAYERHLAALSSPRQCLWCPQVVPGGYDRLKQHLNGHHGFSSFAKAYGHTCPICRTQGHAHLSAHIGRAHGLNLSTAFEWAYYGGDPFARELAEALRSRGIAVTAPAITEEAVAAGHAARKSWGEGRGHA